VVTSYKPNTTVNQTNKTTFEKESAPKGNFKARQKSDQSVEKGINDENYLPPTVVPQKGSAKPGSGQGVLAELEKRTTRTIAARHTRVQLRAQFQAPVVRRESRKLEMVKWTPDTAIMPVALRDEE